MVQEKIDEHKAEVTAWQRKLMDFTAPAKPAEEEVLPAGVLDKLDEQLKRTHDDLGVTEAEHADAAAALAEFKAFHQNQKEIEVKRKAAEQRVRELADRLGPRKRQKPSGKPETDEMDVDGKKTATVVPETEDECAKFIREAISGAKEAAARSPLDPAGATGGAFRSSGSGEPAAAATGGKS